MNQDKLNDMLLHCDEFEGGRYDIDHIEKLARISDRIKDYQKGKIPPNKLISEIRDSKCPFLRNGHTIDGLCSTEPKLKSPEQNKEIDQRCQRCWESFLEVTEDEEDHSSRFPWL